MIDITFILKAIGIIIIGIATRFIIPYFKSKTTNETQQKIYNLVRIAVQAAEQIMDLNSGEDKKEYVVKWLAARNLQIDSKELDAMIESAVYEMKHAFLIENT